MEEYRSAVKDMLPVVGTKRSAKANPKTAYQVTGVKVDVSHLAAYTSSTGLRLNNELPLTYPYVLSFPIVMKVLTAKDFPFAAVGVVHLTNVIEQTRPLTVDDVVDFSVHAENLREHTKGLLIDLVTTVSVDGDVVWKQTSGFLSKGAKLSSSSTLGGKEKTDGRILPAAQLPADPTPTSTVRVTPADIKVYANASGDKNPIHVSGVGAKAFGFPSVIAHGMWSAATMLAVLEGQIPPAARFSVEFAKPVTLPGTVAVFTDGSAQKGWQIQLRKASKLETLHATGAIESLNL
ncbi:MaoC/PaaZ C-terminal domain-containing protein [Corynebacterium heidelbergense]|nr:MaoC/PaaZ C-terminal domain-containing protein [Corynebacterium heidelbergense]